MKQLSLLKDLTQILFVLSLIVMFFLVPLWLLTFVMPETIPFKINGETAANLPTTAKLLAGLLIGGISLFIYALYIFKETLGLFRKKRIFSPDVIKNFRLTGRSILVGFVLIAGGSMLLSISRNTLSIDFNFIAESIFVICLGLFFFVLAEVFQMAKNIKEENDLTV
ncbi:DUF2975 domain-containing protein [Flavobacterium sp. DG1-102-2]|uniref:DUF2975 domain-containing protein n=1 Tax=Flavobacterium sp. DG1-102-2 TaxID=3081663 RepID=UPI00294A34ED|nr:DUF2975 domain-containing protein [Flavobacterium sp. DG1-102-2]MDV6167545.1 DUF2975 domain-containing protein [Flavobacterium sp. DG1-102-2]